MAELKNLDMKIIIQKTNIIKAFILLLCFGNTLNVFAQTPFWKSSLDYNDFTNNWSVIKLGAANKANDIWTWTDNGSLGKNKNSIGKLKSETANDGWAIFDADKICENKTFPNYNEQYVALFSPEISTLNKGTVWLKMDILYKKFYDSVYVIVEKKLATGSKFQNYPLLKQPIMNNQFSDCTLLSPGLAENPHTHYIDLSSFGANSKIKIGIVYISGTKTGDYGEFGCGYAMQIDDMKLFDINPTPGNDLKLKTNFFAIPTNAFTPKCQVEPIRFLVDVANVGKNTQPNIQVEVAITKVINSSVYDTIFKKSTTIGTIKPDSLLQNIVLPFEFKNIENYGGGQYEVNYTVKNDSKDDNIKNNHLKYTFYLSENLFLKDNGSNTLKLELRNDPNSPNWAVANHYHIVKGKNVFAKQVKIPFVNTKGLANRKLNINFYEWNNNDNDIYTATEQELTLVANGEYTLKGTELEGAIVLENLLNPNEPIELKDNTEYLVVMNYFGQNSDTKTLEIFGDNIDYAATSYIYASENKTRLGSLEYDENDKTYYAISGIVASLRLVIDETKICNNVANEDIQPTDIQLFPNPSQGNIQIVGYENVQNINVYDELLSIKKRFVSDATIDLGDLANGIYFIEMILKNGQKVVKKQVVLH